MRLADSSSLFQNFLSQRYLLPILGAYLLYQFIHSVYNLFFHPLSHIPGPKFAAATYFLEFYYDVVKFGHYASGIELMHNKYCS
jgi:hypothetical protein